MPPQKPTDSQENRRKSTKSNSKAAAKVTEDAQAKAERQRLARNARSREDQREARARLSPADRWLKRWRKEANPPIPQAGSGRSQDPRKVALAEGFCPWSDIEEVIRIYTACAIMNELELGSYVVDHIVPLRGIGDLVRGLHVHCNLQVITRRENRHKGNWIWPGMPAVTPDSLLLMRH